MQPEIIQALKMLKTLIRNTRQKGQSSQPGQSDEQQGLTIATS